MKIMTQLNLKGHEKKALQELKEGLTERFPEVKIILYGSKARGDSETFSDIRRRGSMVKKSARILAQN